MLAASFNHHQRRAKYPAGPVEEKSLCLALASPSY